MKNFILLFSLALFASCNLDLPDEPDEPTGTIPLDDLKVPEDFVFNTTNTISLHVTAEDAEGSVLKRVPFRVLLPQGDTLLELQSSTTGDEGAANLSFTLPSYVDKIVINTSFLGLPADKVVNVTPGNISVVLGEENSEGFQGGSDRDAAFLKRFYREPASVALQGDEVQSRGLKAFTYMGAYDKNGKPNYLATPNDKVPQSVLNVINASLPENQPVPAYHPEYIAENITSTVALTSDADLWVTFVHEAAGYRNALGYYSYPTNSPPAKADDIEKLTIIFPNASFKGSGGDLVTGNKVYLGKFKAGTSVGWFLVPDGWNSSSRKVDTKSDIKFSDRQYNTFTAQQYRQHTVLLYDESLEKFILGMEDISRPGGDNDFNDAVFYVTANPYSAVQTGNMAVAVNNNDDDGDGVPNSVDVAPNDPAIASFAHTPAQSVFGTVAFEDLFPAKGDYDLNDIVVDYNFKEYINSENKIVKMDISLKLRASGGVLQNGFGFVLGAKADDVLSVTGQKLTGGYISLAPNGAEAGQDNAVIIAFDDALSLMGGVKFANTDPKLPAVPPVNLNLTVVFKSPMSRQDLGAAPFNPFMIAGKVRGKEVHLPGYPPTKLANAAYFGTGDDATNPAKGKFYKTTGNMPYGILTPASFQYTIERKPVNTGHLKFTQWVESGGTSYPDWYLNKTEYQSSKNLY